MNIRLLDCTLRDGGYVNNWEFSRDTYDTYLIMAANAGIECIEVGIMGKDDSRHFNTKFSSFEEIPDISREGHEDVIYTVMTTIGESENIRLPERGRSVDAIRLAFFKYDIEKALVLGKEIKDQGYQLYMQAMATFMYSESELDVMIQKINELGVDAFYMVDSFGTMFPADVKKMAKSIGCHLDPSIGFGFHAHNNIQLAFANDITFLETLAESGREELFVDASVYGMGRGAGNSPIELVAKYLDESFNKQYDLEILLSMYQDVIREEYEKTPWGYSMTYYLTSSLRINSAYVWYLTERKGIRDFQLLKKILTSLPEKDRYTLRKDVVEQIIKDLGY